MSRFVFRLQSLLDYRKNRRELCLQLLAQLLEDERRYMAQRTQLDRMRLHQLDELRRLGLDGEVDIDRSAARRFYSGQLVGDMHLVERNQQLVAGQIELCRQTLGEADRQVKVLEKLQEKHYAEFVYDQQKTERHELEDAWMAGRAAGYTR